MLQGVARVVMPAELGLSWHVDETADTFEGNALLKAETGLVASGVLTVADDSGLCVDALAGNPGVRSARFAEDAGRGRGDAANNALLLERLADVPDGKRQAHFVSVIAVVAPGATPQTFRGEVHGSLAHAPRGRHGFGYDPLFLLPDGRAMAELPAEEKNALSHRARAFATARPHLLALLRAGALP